MVNGFNGEEGEVAGRLWRFGQCELDESSRELRIKGALVDIESKPLEVLYQLLIHAGEVVTKDELLDAVWPGLSVVDGSLATAVSKLRKALGEDDSPIVLTVPRVGYRLGVPVQSRRVDPPHSPQLGFKAGDAVPGREQWQLIRQLDQAGSSEVWLAEHPKTREARVFKFAFDGVQLKGLKREVTLSRFLKESLGERADLVRVLEWNFESPPFYLESEYCGPNLLEWAESQGGLDRVPYETRVGVLVEIAGAVAAAHDVGVLHKDLKPANVLMTPKPEGGWQVRVADFGSGSMAEPGRLQSLGITNLGFTQSEIPEALLLTGTLMYLAPEVLAGHSPTASADVYALGVLLYQLVVADFRRPLSPGWEAEVEDPLVCEDIAAAASGDPVKRLITVAALVERLSSLAKRREERDELALTQERAQVAERRLRDSKARRPWIAAAVLLLAAGLAVSLALYGRASGERDRANRQTEIARSMNQFLATDLLGRSNPFQSGKAGETLVDAIRESSPDIDRQFQHAPEVAARLHQSIAKALDLRTDYPDARREYDRAAALFLQTGGRLSQDGIIVGLQRAAMEARTYEQGSLARARAILAEQEAKINGLSGGQRADLAVWLFTARGMVALIGNDAKSAARFFQSAFERAETLPDFDESARLTLKQRLGFSYIRLGDGAAAERTFRELIEAWSRVNGAESPYVLRVRMNLAQAYMIEGKHRQVIEETSRLYPAYVTRLGEDHELSLQLLSTRAQSEGSLGLWADAIRDDLKIHELAVRKQGPASFFALATLTDAALAQCRAGRLGEGEANARKAFDLSAKAFGPRAGLTGATAYSLASCLIGLKKWPEAAGLLENIDGKVVVQLTGMPDWFANVTLAQAQISYAQRNFAASRRQLASAVPVFAKADAEPYQKQAVQALTLLLAKQPEK